MTAPQQAFSLPAPREGDRDICIIGGGISGLSLAWYLLQRGWRPTVLEAQSRPGGNCRTMQVVLDPTRPNRWADMGVNDYNADTYKKLNDLMAQTGYNAGLPLQDSEAYGNSSGTVVYTNDGKRNTQMPAEIAQYNDKFQTEAPVDCELPEYRYYTVERYVREKGYPDSFIYDNLYARINGMYFCNGAPGEMPFVAIMHYYKLQEGYNPVTPPKPDRRYFKGGTDAWIDSLRNKLREVAGYDVVYSNGHAATVTFDPGGYHIVSMGGETARFYQVVMAMHADDAIAAFTNIQDVPGDIINMLGRFPYAPSTAVVHTDTRALQPGQHSFRTYNIHVYDFAHDGYGPYTITYVANRHQNDAANPAYSTDCENPQYYISLNPPVWPAESSILKQPNGDPAIFRFKHQKLNLDMLNAQETVLPGMQGRYGLWYCNGYALGAGLHEECLTLAANLAAKINGEPAPEKIHYGHTEDGAQFAPDYVAGAHDDDYQPTTFSLTNQAE